MVVAGEQPVHVHVLGRLERAAAGVVELVDDGVSKEVAGDDGAALDPCISQRGDEVGAAAGQAVLDPLVTARVIAAYGSAPAPGPRAAELERLTERETDVLRLVAQGLNNLEIAARLFLGEATVKTHFGRVLAKLGLRDRVQAVIAAYESGLVGTGERRDRPA